MKKGFAVLLSILVVVLVFVGIYFIYGISVYNKAVKLQETHEARWADVQAAYQRRADLIPNIAKAAKAGAEREQAILTEVTALRAGISKAAKPGDLDVMGTKITSAINLAFEAYPEVRSNQNYRDLMTSLEGTENRINVERRKYNEAVAQFNNHIRGYIKSMVLERMAKDEDNFIKQDKFEAREGADEVPDVDEYLNDL